LATLDSYTRPQQLDGMLAMTGPSVSADPGCLPVRGDLAHVKLAGLYFVPHYAVPMPHTVLDGAVLRATGRADGAELRALDPGSIFNVLDIAGAWTWGQLGEDGQVGYVAHDRLAAIV
jgi:hypothetical protein